LSVLLDPVAAMNVFGRESRHGMIFSAKPYRAKLLKLDGKSDFLYCNKHLKLQNIVSK